MPVREAIYVTTLLLNTSAVKVLPVDKNMFTELLEFVRINAFFLTESGYYRQADGVATTSPVGPLLTKIFMSQFDEELRSHPRFYLRFFGDIL